MSDELDNFTDAQISEIFAVEIAGYIKYTDGTFDEKEVDWEKERPRVVKTKELKFATSADAVMPWLEKYCEQRAYRRTLGGGTWWTVEVTVIIMKNNEGYREIEASAPTFARAACIALIRAARARKGAAQ